MSLPETWMQTTVRAVVMDMQPGFAQKPGEEDEGTTPQIRTHNVTPDGKISLEGIKHITASERELARYSLAVGDVVFNNTNSEEWVGKTAVFNREGDFVFSNHMTRLRVRKDLVCPEYLAAYLQLLWSMGYSKTRAKRWVSQAGIESDTLAAFKIPLPTLPEQQRIVDVLQHAEGSIQVNERRGYLDQMINAALDRLVLGCDEGEWEQLGSLVETRYGTSVSADATAGTGVPVLRIPNVMGGEVDIGDMKYVELTQAELGRLSLTTSDVLIVRSNGNPEYVGRSAPITGDVCQSVIVYASYLIRLRTDAGRLLPEYLSAFLNSAYGRAAMRNAIRTTAGQSNLSGENLSKVRLPVPDFSEQERFRRLWLQVREIRRLITRSEDAAIALRSALSIHALSGDLTAQWREHHAAALADAALSRDELLRERGAEVTLHATITATSSAQADLTVRPARHWLLGELSDFQRQVLAVFTTYCQVSGEPLLVEDPDVFARFCDDTAVTERLQVFGTSHGNRIRRSLSQLAALGLIAKVTLPKVDSESGERDYLKAFRPLREDEFTRLSDMQALRKSLSPNTDVEAS
jgi:type I restriction enzyme, S subunit